jgi:hypothetical protein
MLSKTWNRRGAVGIGTTIIYIAMLTISGAAGSMILNNTSLAGNEAQGVVDDTLDGTTNYLMVKSVVGICNSSTGELEGMEMMVSLGPGSDSLNLSAVTIEVLQPDDHTILGNWSSDLEMERIRSSGRSESAAVMTEGDLFIFRFDLPTPARGGDEVQISLIPANGFVNFIIIDVPDNITSTYVALR